MNKTEIIRLGSLNELKNIKKYSVVEADDGSYLICRFPLEKCPLGNGEDVQEMRFVRKGKHLFENQEVVLTKEKSYVKNGRLGIKDAKFIDYSGLMGPAEIGSFAEMVYGENIKLLEKIKSI